MKRAHCYLLLAAITLLTASAAMSQPGAPTQQQAQAVQQIVDQFYPQTLVDEAAAHPRIPLRRESAFAVLDRLPDGTPRTIVAAYSNSVEAAVRVLQRQANGQTAVAFESFDFGDHNPGVELIDLDGDGSNEVVVTFVSVTGIETSSIFRWNGSSLIYIGPDGESPANASFIDLFHDGTLALLTVDDPHPPASPDQPITGAFKVFRLKQGKYVLDRPILDYAAFFRKTGSPRSDAEDFSLPPNSIGPFLLRVVNGERGGANRVSSAHIVLNGVEVIGPSRFNQRVEFMSVPISLKPNNTLQVTLEGKPGGEIQITVEDTAAVQAAQQQR